MGHGSIGQNVKGAMAGGSNRKQEKNIRVAIGDWDKAGKKWGKVFLLRKRVRKMTCRRDKLPLRNQKNKKKIRGRPAGPHTKKKGGARGGSHLQGERPEASKGARRCNFMGKLGAKRSSRSGAGGTAKVSLWERGLGTGVKRGENVLPTGKRGGSRLELGKHKPREPPGETCARKGNLGLDILKGLENF